MFNQTFTHAAARTKNCSFYSLGTKYRDWGTKMIECELRTY